MKNPLGFFSIVLGLMLIGVVAVNADNAEGPAVSAGASWSVAVTDVEAAYAWSR